MSDGKKSEVQLLFSTIKKLRGGGEMRINISVLADAGENCVAETLLFKKN